MTHQCSSPCSKELRDIGDCVCELMNWERLNDEKGCIMIYPPVEKPEAPKYARTTATIVDRLVNIKLNTDESK